MPIILNVAHLPSASSFFLSALQPLGYRYQYTQGNRMGLGVHHADFFLQQSSDNPRSRHSPEHIRFHSPSRAAVRECYAAALYAGARPLHPPDNRITRIGEREAEVFNTFIMDRDGNNIEVTYGHDEFDRIFAGSEVSGSAIRGWQRNVADEYMPSRAATEVQSYGSRRRSASRAGQSMASDRRSWVEPAAPSHVSKRSSARSATVPMAVPPPPPEGLPVPSLVRQFSGPVENMIGKTEDMSGTVPMKTVAGTMLGAAAGAAAGAAFAYSMCKSGDGTTTRERWRYLKWDNEGPSQYADHEGSVPASQAAAGLPSQMSRLAIEPPPPRSRASGPPMAYDRYEPRSSRAPTRSDADGASRPRSSSHASARNEQASRRSSSHVSRSQSTREPSRHSTHRASSESRRSSHPPAPSSRREESRHSHRTRTSYTFVDPPPTHSSGRGTSHNSHVTAVRDQPREATIFSRGEPLVDEPQDMELDNLDNETVVPSDSISCAGDKYSRRSAGRSLKSSSGTKASGHRSSKYGGEMKSFHDRIIDIERSGGGSEPPLSARRVTRMVY